MLLSVTKIKDNNLGIKGLSFLNNSLAMTKIIRILGVLDLNRKDKALILEVEKVVLQAESKNLS